MEIKHTKHAVGQSAYHLVWRPKYNVSVFRHAYPRIVCENAIKEIAKQWKIEIIELKVMPDHIHCFVDLPASISVSMALQVLKGGSARIFFKRCTRWRAFFSLDGERKPHLWSPGKFFRSVGSVTAEVIEEYIKYSQEEWNFDFKDLRQKRIEEYRRT
jgi:putative transposase